MAITGLSTITKKEPTSTYGWNTAEGFMRNLGDVLTADLFDFNNNKSSYAVAPIQTAAPSSNGMVFSKALIDPTPGTLKAAATTDPQGFMQWLGSVNPQMRQRVNQVMAKQGWTPTDIGYDPNAGKMNQLIDAQIQGQNLANQRYTDRMNSFWGKNADAIKGLGTLAGAAGSLAGIYSGFKQLDMMKDQLDIAKEQWATTKDELNRVRKVRDKLSSSYMA